VNNYKIQFLSKRFVLLILGFLLLMAVLMGRMIYLSAVDRSFLLTQGNSRYVRVISIPAYRGMILDSTGNPLAVSTPVDSIWMNPQDFPNIHENRVKIGHILNIQPLQINELLQHSAKKQFVYLKRGVSPGISAKIKMLGIPGIYLEREFKRFYPVSEAAAQVIGFTNIDDKGQSGLELAYNQWLRGSPGKEKVLQDRYGHTVAQINEIKAASPGHDLTLSINSQLQFLAYQTLKTTIDRFSAESGSVVALNPKTGEILAMVNIPSFNPNNRPDKDTGQFRNRAVTDMFEPGSTMKAFSIASALDSEKYTPTTIIDATPFILDGHKIRDEEFNYGKITVTQVLQKSSNVGVTKMTLSLPPEHFIDLLHRIGFGQLTSSGFPGESPGVLVYHDKWRPFDLATLAFGYSIAVTSLQLANAYSILANHGLNCPITFMKQDKTPNCAPVINTRIADEMVTMLEAVEQEGGTGTRAKIAGYKIAGKTGTAYIAGRGGYDDKNSITSSFVGIAPASDPQLVIAVIIQKPQHEHHGAIVAAPAFAKIMGGALNMLNIPPDNIM
jgi:cell division protein FtsI (penicillin-binding protein 3)